MGGSFSRFVIGAGCLLGFLGFLAWGVFFGSGIGVPLAFERRGPGIWRVFRRSVVPCSVFLKIAILILFLFLFN